MRILGTSRSRGRILALLGALLCAAGVMPGVGAAGTPPVCAGKAATIWGGDADDTLVGTAANDVIAGLGGKDTIRGGGGNDTICGGLGADRIFGDAGNDRVLGEGGNDTIRGGAGADILNGGGGADAIYGGDGSDSLVGGAGDDLLDGETGGNTADAGDGTDSCFRASDVADSCEPTWLEWDESLMAVDSQHDSDVAGACPPNLDRSFPEYADVDGQSHYQNLAHVFGTCLGGLATGDWIYSDYLLGRDYRRFVVTLGLSDLSVASGVPIRYEVFGDGVQLLNQVVNYGEHYDLKLDVTGVLRLRLKTTLLTGYSQDFQDDVVIAVFGSPIVSANTRIAGYPPVG